MVTYDIFGRNLFSYVPIFRREKLYLATLSEKPTREDIIYSHTGAPELPERKGYGRKLIRPKTSNSYLPITFHQITLLFIQEVLKSLVGNLKTDGLENEIYDSIRRITQGCSR